MVSTFRRELSSSPSYSWSSVQGFVRQSCDTYADETARTTNEQVRSKSSRHSVSTIVAHSKWYAGSVLLLGLMTIAAGRADGSLPSHVVDGPSAIGVHRATLAVLSGANAIDITRASGTSALYRVTTAKNDGVVPSARDSRGNVDVHLSNVGTGHGANLSVRLAPRVNWGIRLAGGATDERLDLSNLVVSSLSVPAGVSDLDIRLGIPHGTSTIAVAGGASVLDVVAPASVTVRIDFVGGAGSASLDGVGHSGLPGNTMLTSPGTLTTSGINITCPGGIGTFILTRSST
jgi:hypothetical protein